jgi:hypothetical protein
MELNDKVRLVSYTGLSTTVNDKYNPLDMDSIIVNTNAKFNPIEVVWDNGIKNSYNEINLKLV